MKFTVPPSYDGKILKQFLYESCKISTSALTMLKKMPLGITLNGDHVTVRAVLKSGDILELRIEDREEDENEYTIPSGELPEILYEDESVMVFNKPSGMPTHTSLDHREGCLANAVCAHFKRMGQSFVFRAVNRLDADTTGIVLVAKNRYYAALLSRSLANGEFQKEYIAVLDGNISEEGRISGYISREKESIIKRVLSNNLTKGADYSETSFTRIALNNGISVVLARPITGRTHQLRLHFSSVGAPICGDFLYGNISHDIPRQALHAYSLSFPSPATGSVVKVTAPIPPDIQMLLENHSVMLPEKYTENENY